MSSAKSGAIYLSSTTSVRKKPSKKPSAVFFSALLAFVTLLLALSPITQPSPSSLKAEAGAIPAFCRGDLGWAMEQQGWGNKLFGYTAEDVAGRRLTAQEAFGGPANMLYTVYQGEGEGDFLTRETDPKRLGELKGDEATKRVEDLRNSGNCALGALGANFSSLVLSGATVVSGIAGSFASFAFNSNIICDEPGQSGACFDLLKIIGGGGGQSEGLIGALTSSIYLPLLTLIGLVAAIWIGWTGIVQRKLREALWGFIWVVTSVILGLAFLLNPSLLAKAPMAVSNTLSSCVISAFGGNNCLSGAQEPEQLSSSDVCKTDASRAPLDEQMGLIVEGLTCQVWKAFVLEPYSQGSFGQSFEAMDTKNPGAVLEKALEESGEDPDKFCVGMNLYSGETLNSNGGGTLRLTGDPVCNVVLYQLYLKTDASYNGGAPNADTMDEYGIDSRWTKIINLSANNDTLWKYWPTDNSHVTHKLMVSGLALLASLLGGIVIAAVAIFAVMYYVSAIFLTAFAPLFFLIGVHPGRGRDVLKGYGEIVISNVLKYIASALFLVVTIALYGGILGNVSDIGTTLLFVLVMSLALLLYRKEITELLGRVDMGGKQLTSGLGGKLGAMGKSSARFGAVALGSATGASLAGGSFSAGLKDGVSRELKAGRVPVLGELPGGEVLKQGVAGAARGVDATSNKNERELRNDARQADAEAKEAANEERVAQTEFGAAVADYEEAQAELNGLAQAIEELRSNLEGQGQEKILEDMAASLPGGQEYAEAARLGGAISILDKRIADGTSSGQDVRDLVSQRDDLAERRQMLAANLQESGQLSPLRAHYNTEISKYNAGVEELSTKIEAYRTAAPVVEERFSDVEAARDRVASAAGRSAAAKAEEIALATTIEGISQGTVVTSKTVDRVKTTAREAGEGAREEVAANTAASLAESSPQLTEATKREFAKPERAAVVTEESVAQDVLGDLGAGTAMGLPVAPAGGQNIADEPHLPGTGGGLPTAPLRERKTSSKNPLTGDSAPEPVKTKPDLDNPNQDDNEGQGELF